MTSTASGRGGQHRLDNAGPGGDRERAPSCTTGGLRRSGREVPGDARRAGLLAKHPQQFRHFSGGAGLPTFGLERPDGTRLLLQWRQGQVTVMRVSLDVAADAALIAPLARELDAHVYAEDGTRYA